MVDLSEAIADPSESEPIIRYLENNKIDLKFILNTHHHYDHVGGNQKIQVETPLQ